MLGGQRDRVHARGLPVPVLDGDLGTCRRGRSQESVPSLRTAASWAGGAMRQRRWARASARAFRRRRSRTSFPGRRRPGLRPRRSRRPGHGLPGPRRTPILMSADCSLTETATPQVSGVEAVVGVGVADFADGAANDLGDIHAVAPPAVISPTTSTRPVDGRGLAGHAGLGVGPQVGVQDRVRGPGSQSLSG